MEEKPIHKIIKDYINCLYYNEEDIKKEIKIMGEEETRIFIFDKYCTFTLFILEKLMNLLNYIQN